MITKKLLYVLISNLPIFAFRDSLILILVEPAQDVRNQITFQLVC